MDEITGIFTNLEGFNLTVVVGTIIASYFINNNLKKSNTLHGMRGFIPLFLGFVMFNTYVCTKAEWTTEAIFDGLTNGLIAIACFALVKDFLVKKGYLKI